jgi:hypothetical protein
LARLVAQDPGELTGEPLRLEDGTCKVCGEVEHWVDGCRRLLTGLRRIVA